MDPKTDKVATSNSKAMAVTRFAPALVRCGCLISVRATCGASTLVGSRRRWLNESIFKSRTVEIARIRNVDFRFRDSKIFILEGNAVATTFPT